jgi:hypothetical protein
VDHIVDFDDGSGMFETFTMPGKSQPSGEPREVRMWLPDAKKAALDKYLDSLGLTDFSDQEYVINTPDGSKKSATFIKWHGIYGLFYVPADDMTVAVPLPEIPNVVSTLTRGK